MASVTRGESEHMAHFRCWLDSGLHGRMDYLSRPDAVARRGDLDRTLPGFRSALVVAHSYADDRPADPARRPLPRRRRALRPGDATTTASSAPGWTTLARRLERPRGTPRPAPRLRRHRTHPGTGTRRTGRPRLVRQEHNAHPPAPGVLFPSGRPAHRPRRWKRPPHSRRTTAAPAGAASTPAPPAPSSATTSTAPP